MMIEEAKVSPGSKTRKMVIQLLVGGVIGLGGVYGTDVVIDSGVLGKLGRSQEIALSVAMFCGVIGLLVGFGIALPSTGARLLNVEDEGDLREQRRMLA